MVATVVRDLGAIGVNGRQLVVVSVPPDEDEGVERHEFDVPAEELTVVASTAA